MNRERQAKPNIVFLFTDDQRFDTIHALGNPRIQTPHMDELVRRGTAFTHAFIPGGTCGAVCMPSRAMLHTGRTLFHLKDAGATIPEEHTTLGEHLRKQGYRTFGSGKWHNSPESYHRSFTDGAEIFFGGMADHWNVPAANFDPSGQYLPTRAYNPAPFSSGRVEQRHFDHIHPGRHSTDLVAEAGLDFLRGYRDRNPYFLYLSFLAPHDPRNMPGEYLDRYDSETIPVPENFLPHHPFDNGELDVRDEKLASFPRTESETRRHLAEYYAMITHLDERIGEVMAAVEARGELENTLFILAGDNGLALGQHGLMGKQSLYDHSVRVPLLMAGPGIPAGQRCEAMVYLFDIFPTLCDLLEVGTPDSVEGMSLRAAIQEGASGRETVYLAYRGFQRAVRTRQHKLVEYVVEGQHTQSQLFDLKQDPWETRNLINSGDLAPLQRELRGLLKDFSEAWDDPQSSWGKEFWSVYSR